VWWQLPQAALLASFESRQDALDGFLGAAYALHIVATVAVMADARDLQKAVGNGDGAWFAASDQKGRGTLKGAEGGDVALVEVQQFVPTVYLYDNFPGGVGLSEPLWTRQEELVRRASSWSSAATAAAARHAWARCLRWTRAGTGSRRGLATGAGTAVGEGRVTRCRTRAPTGSAHERHGGEVAGVEAAGGRGNSLLRRAR
jgi:hypothetical protein